MPHILCIANYFREHGGGIEQMAHHLAQELAADGDWTVTLAAHGTSEAKPDSGEGYQRLTIRAANGIERRFGLPLLIPHPIDMVALRRAVRQADVVIIHDCVYLAHLFALRCLPTQTPAIVVKHTGQVRFSGKAGTLLFSLLNRYIFPSFLRKARTLVFVTQSKRDSFPAVPGIAAQVIVNGIDTRLFAPSGALRDDYLLFVGRFVDKKGIQVIKEMAQLMPERRFTLAGFGPTDPRNWGLPNVECLWSPNAKAIAALYCRAAAVILPGETEGTPLVALEALACETPVVIGETGTAPDRALARQLTLLPVDIDNPVQTAQLWAARLDSAIAHSTPDRKVIVASYSTRKMADAYRNLIARLEEL